MKENNITITIYWPPTENYINDEQYSYLAEAGINYVLGAGEETLHTPQNQQKMLSLCEKYGLEMTLNDGTFGPSLLSASEGEIAKRVGKYSSHPALGGYYLQDEPINPNVYIKAARAIKKADPERVLHLNFFPYVAYPDKATYEKQMRDWCLLCHANGFEVDYLTYDLYPFGFDEGSMNREAFFENLDICRRVGLDHGVKTGIYLQSVGLIGGYPAPDERRLEYEINLSLAYGFKWLSYFTWFTPINRPNESFENGIMTSDGKKTPLFDIVKRQNKRIKSLGRHLISCDAREVYCNGTSWGGEPIPQDYFVRPCDKLSYTLSHLTSPDGDYIMVVNNNFLKSQKIKLCFTDNILPRYFVGEEDGELCGIYMSDSILSLELAPGACRLIKLSGVPERASKAENGEKNLALGAKIYATSSLGENGCYIASLNDGVRKQTEGNNGWRSSASECCDITIDFGEKKRFNRIDMYRAEALFFPRSFSVSVSDDGLEYAIIGSCNKYKLGNKCACSIVFDSIEARFVKISIAKQVSALCQIEIYNDDGECGSPLDTAELYGDKCVVEYTHGEDIALHKPVYSSSHTSADYEKQSWGKDFVNDGKKTTGFSSSPGRNAKPDGCEYVIIDLGDTFKIERIDLTCKGYFPIDYSLLVSENGGAWRQFVSIEGMKKLGDGMTVEHTADSEPIGRYVMLRATRMRGDERDGYMLQIGAMEVYGKPVCDTKELKKALEKYERSGGDICSSVYTEAITRSDKGELTQSSADRYARLLLEAIDPSGSAAHNEDVVEVFEPELIESRSNKKAVKGLTAAAGVLALAAAAIGTIVYNKRKK